LRSYLPELSNLHGFYSRRSHQVQFALTAIALCYGGGGAMFWLHAIYRGEAGPPISAPYHWFLDSTLGLVALAPAIFVLLPVTSRRLGGRRHGLQPVALGVLFAVITTPGPIMHDRVAGHGTPLAQLATSVFGRDAGVAARNLHAVSHSALSECLLQLGVGLPVYVILAHVALRLGRARTANVRSAQVLPILATPTDESMGQAA